MSKKTYDLVVFGATSFVGQILTRYLWQRHGLKGEVKWAIAGRSAAKLAEVKAAVGALDLPVIIANADDAASLKALTDQTRVIVSTVGPYALYGSDLVKVCAETGTDYCDLTGEIQWIDRMIRAHEAKAKETGARIVHCCGFDSIPSDVGVYFLQREAKARFGAPAQRVKMRVKAMRGGFSGGTVASMIQATKEVLADPAVRKAMGNPYAIAPSSPKVRQPNVSTPQFDEDAKSWLAPFVMAAINTRVVHRSNGLTGWSYGDGFKYDEAMMTGPGIKGRAMAAAITAGLGGFFTAAAVPPSRWVLERFVVPKPGEGPSPESQDKGFYDIRFFGTTADGKRLQTQVKGDKDPGYGSTAKMLGEAAVCIANDTQGKPGGFWTPATLLGDALIERLEKHAGVTFEVKG